MPPPDRVRAEPADLHAEPTDLARPAPPAGTLQAGGNTATTGLLLRTEDTTMPAGAVADLQAGGNGAVERFVARSIATEPETAAAAEGVAGQPVGRFARVGQVDPYLSVRSAMDPRKITTLPDPLVIDTLAFNDRVFVLERYPDDWVKVRTDNGNIGYAYGKKLFEGMPDPQSRLHQVQPSETALGIAQQTYNCGEWGRDGRFFVNALVSVNKASGNPAERKGIFKKEGADTDAVDSWKDAELLAGYWIWLPDETFARSLAGSVSSGSVTYEAWQAVEGVVGFAVGVLEGIASSLVDLVMGLVDLAAMIVDLVVDIARNGIAAKANELRAFFDKLDVAEIASAIWSDFAQRWNAPDAYDRWQFRGLVVGMVLAEIALAALSGGATLALKIAGKVGKLAKLAAQLLKLDVVLDFVRGVDKAGDATEAGRAARKLLQDAEPDLPGGAKNANAAVLLGNQLRTAEAAGPLTESLRATGKLPANYVTKAQAEAAGWRPGKALENYIPGAQIGGDVFQNTTKIVPSAPGRVWYEADVGLVGDMTRAKQPGTRLLYSSDGLAYVTFDHYQSAIQILGWK